MSDPVEVPRATRNAVVFWAVAALFVAVLAAFRVAAQALLLAFAGVLFGTALRGAAEWVSRKLGWHIGWSLAACLGVLAGLGTAAGFLIAPQIAEQAKALSGQLASAYHSLRGNPESGLGRLLSTGGGSLQGAGQYVSRAAGLLSSAAGMLGALLFVLFIALYVAFSPEIYRRGAIELLPARHRERGAALLGELAGTLRRWLLGRIVSMTAVGVATSLGLWIIGIPLPITLGLLAGLLGFVPNIGPIVSAIPALLLAATISPAHIVYVLALYAGINLGDGYGLTPWLQKLAVSVPPALIITAQVLFGAFWGLLGVTLATPLLASLLVVVRRLYVEPVADRAQPGAGPPASPARRGEAHAH